MAAPTYTAFLNKIPGNAVYEAKFNNPSIRGRLLDGKFDPKFIVMHHTAGTDSLVLLASGGDHKPIPGAHFLVCRDGSLHVLTMQQCYHAGSGSGFGIPDNLMNPYSWGIEVESLGKEPDFTRAQKKTLGKLIYRLQRLSDIPDEHIINHRDWSNTGKTDTLYSRKQILSWRDEYVESLLPQVSLFDVQPGDTGPSVRLVQKALVQILGGQGVKIRLRERVAKRFGKTTREAYAAWQRRLGYAGSDADGKPGSTSLLILARRSGLFRV